MSLFLIVQICSPVVAQDELPPEPAVTATPENLSVETALDEMRAIEQQIQLKLEEQASRENEIEKMDDRLKLTETMMDQPERIERSHRESLRTMKTSFERELSVMDEARKSSREQLADAQGAIEMTLPLVYGATKHSGIQDAKTLALTLLHKHHRDRAHIAVEQALRIEELKVDRRDRSQKVGERLGIMVEIGELSVDELRERHKELSGRLEGLYTASENSRNDIRYLENQRKAVDDLVVALSSGDTGPELLARLARINNPATDEIPPPPDEDALGPDGQPLLAEVPYEEQDALALGARQGDGTPTMELEFDEDPLAAGEGLRREFWKPGLTAVHALGAGQVLFGGAFAGYRNLVIIDHGDEWLSIYGNLNATELVEGDKLKKGEEIGNYQDPDARDMLWVEVRHKTSLVDVESLPGLGEKWQGLLFGDR